MQTQKPVKKHYEPLNLFYEAERLQFYLKRDGLEAALAKAKELQQIYLQASLKTRIKNHTRNYPYRQSYIESAYSVRFLIRTKHLEQYAEMLS